MSHLSSASTVASPGTNITATRPAGAGAAHILIAAVWRDSDQNGAMTASTGWTLISSTIHTAYPAAQVNVFWARGDVAALVFSDPPASGSSGKQALVSAFAGRNLTTPIGANAAAESVSTSIAIPSMTTGADSDVFATWADFQATIGGPLGGSPPAGYTDRVNNTVGDTQVTGATAEGVAAGSTGALSRSAGNFTAKIGVGVVVASAGGGGGGEASVNVVIL